MTTERTRPVSLGFFLATGGIVALVVGGASAVALLSTQRPSTTGRAEDRGATAGAIDDDALHPDPAPAELRDISAMRFRGDVPGLIRVIIDGRPADGVNDTTDDDHVRRRRTRVTAVHALANVGGQAASEALRGFVAAADEEIAIRLAAADALARAGSNDDVAWLRTRADAEDHALVRDKIRASLAAHHR